MKSECRWALGKCFGCGESGHFVRECQSPRMIRCFECGVMGHRAVECGLRGRGNGGRCGNCGERGHFARMCKRGRGQCQNCGIEGHVEQVCNQRTRDSREENPGNGVRGGLNVVSPPV